MPTRRWIGWNAAIILGLVRGTLVVALGAAEVFAQSGRGPEWPFDDHARAALDREFIASMTRHHEAGVEFARAAWAGSLSREARRPRVDGADYSAPKWHAQVRNRR